MSIFSSVLMKKPGRNKFDLSFTNTLSMNIGELVPVLVKDLVPGDKFRVNSQVFSRLMPMVSPAFGNLRLYIHYFFVPNRLVWDKWEDFITGGEDGKQTPAFPYLKITEGLHQNLPDDVKPMFGPGTLSDYLGYNSNLVKTGAFESGSALRHRAYALIWNEWYRDQNIDSKIHIGKDNDGLDPLSPADANDSLKLFGYGKVRPDGTIDANDLWRGTLLRRRYLKDYFTSALPWPYRGDDVTLPFAAQDMQIVSDATSPTFKFHPSYASDAPNSEVLGTDGDGTLVSGSISDGYYEENGPIIFDHTGLKATLSNVTSATINDLRRAVSLQRFFELSARAGNRYIEQILSHFGVHSKDARLQRPEFLGGGVTPIQIGEVLQTSATVQGVSPQGNLAGRGVAFSQNNNGCTYYATEHGMLFGIASIVPDAFYFQGIDTMLQKFDRLDYYWPSFAHLGEQQIKKKELVYTGTSADNELFGYAPRYAEYKHSRNELHGDFKPVQTANGPVSPLEGWTFSRRFEGSTALTPEFLEIPNIENPFAVQDNGVTDKFIVDVYNKIDALRPMPFYGEPRLI